MWITIKKTYINEEVVSEEYAGNVIKKSSINKIIEIGGADYSSNYTVRVGNYVYVTTDELNLYKEKSEESQIVEELKRQDKVKVLKINNSWRLSFESFLILYNFLYLLAIKIKKIYV